MSSSSGVSSSGASCRAALYIYLFVQLGSMKYFFSKGAAFSSLLAHINDILVVSSYQRYPRRQLVPTISSSSSADVKVSQLVLTISSSSALSLCFSLVASTIFCQTSGVTSALRLYRRYPCRHFPFLQLGSMISRHRRQACGSDKL